MKLIIAGSRNIYPKVSELNKIKTMFYMPEVTEVVCGMASGVDTSGAYWASVHKLPIKEFPADWEAFGKRAGFLRNQEMAEYADGLLAIWDGISKGTSHMINAMQRLEKPTWIYLYANQL